MVTVTKDTSWELTILAADISKVAVGDVDGDGQVEVITSKDGKLGWLRPEKGEEGFIADIEPHVGAVLEDIDGDGHLELFLSDANPTENIFMLKIDGSLDRPWKKHVIDPAPKGGAHDVLLADIDGCGKKELLCNAMYTSTPGLFIYKPGDDITKPWNKHVVQELYGAEGTDAADIDGDGQLEIVTGPYLFHAPEGGPYAGKWIQMQPAAPNFREMCRAGFLDITGNGKPDLVMVESEYPDGKFSWFENTPEGWTEHRLAEDYNFAHSLDIWQDEEGSHIFIAEMAKGGWGAPYNWNARLAVYSTTDKGTSFNGDVIYTGAGTHEAELFDYDNDGQLEVVGKECYSTRIQLWEKAASPSLAITCRHRFLDREKPYTGTDIVAADVDGDGADDVICGAWWYKSPTWERYDIPGVYQVIYAYDIDGDGRKELIATKEDSTKEGFYPKLTSRLVWLKPVDPVNGTWEEHEIGTGDGAWPHATLIAPFLPGNKLAMINGYHGPGGESPDLFEIPDDPTRPWPRRTATDAKFGEEMVAASINGSGNMDIMGCDHYLKNNGDGTFTAHQITDQKQIARVALMDINGNGSQDMVFVVENVDYKEKVAAFVEVGWLENPGDPTQTPWKRHVIDTVRSPHSLSVADIDKDGEEEIIVGEHDPFKPYRNSSRLLVYKKADPAGNTWKRFVLDNRFEHHDGTKLIDLGNGKTGIMSHGWSEPKYVHLWEISAQ